MGQLVSLSLALLLLPLVLLAATADASAQPAAWDCAPATPTSRAAATPTGTPAPVAFPATGGNLTVFAAASLTDAFAQIKTDLEAAHAGLAITYNFGGSQTLVTQLQEGARADVFASANMAQMEPAVAAGLVAGEPRIFVRNALAIVTPPDNPAEIEGAADLGKPGLRLDLAQPEVPAGRYARQAVCRMAADTASYGAEFTARVAGNIVSGEEDVRSVLAKVALGEADAGIVYVSDAAAAGNTVHLVAIPEAVNIQAAYPVAVLADGDRALGDAFVAYLVSAEGQATLAAFGFAPLG
jgi:molybdate transport system substrate-binding protein